MKTWPLIAIAAALGAGATQVASAQPPAPPSFDQIDADKSGALSQQEVTQFFLQMFQNMPGGPGGAGGRGPGGPGGPGAGGPGAGQGGPGPEGMMAVLFQNWDANKDGSVSKEEFDNRPRMQGGPGPGGGPN